MAKEGSHCIFLTVALIYSVFRLVKTLSSSAFRRM